MNNVRDQAEERLATYRSEANIQRQLPKNLWRSQVAQVLRGMAAWLERPLPPTLHDDWHMRVRKHVD